MDSFTNLNTVTSRIPTDQDNNISDLNKELAQQLNDEMTRAVLPVTVFVGIEVFAAFFGNLLIIYVFLFRYHVCNFRYFVLCLAFTDITSSLTTMPGEMVTQLYWYVYPVPEVCKIKSFFNVFTVSAEALCLLTIGVDRYLKVCRPLGWQMKPKHAKYLCGIIYIVAFILALPVSFLWGTHRAEKIYNNTTIIVTICEKDEKWLNTNSPLQYSVSMEVILSVCLVVMFVLYVFVARTLLINKRLRFRANSAGQSPSGNSEMSPNPVETNSTPEDSESDYTSRDDRKSTNVDKLEGNRNDTGNEPATESQNRTLSAVTDADHEPREKHNKILNLIRHIRTGTNHREANTHHSHHRHTRSEHAHGTMTKIRRRTLMMFILTVVFIITTILYLTLLSFIAKSILDTMNDSSKAVYFFFFRLYFINHVINPIVYGVLDPHFRQVIKDIRQAFSTTDASRYNN